MRRAEARPSISFSPAFKQTKSWKLIATMTTHTKAVNCNKLAAHGRSAITVIKLMMACNDVSLAEDAFGKWFSETSRLRGSRKTGAKMYFIRLQLSHLVEALKIIEEIKNDKFLFSLVERCDPKTKKSFAILENCLPNGSMREKFERLAGRIRHNLVFHYDESGKLISSALSDRVKRHQHSASSITRGSHGDLWHFALADEILDQIVVRQIWKIPSSANLRAEADACIEWVWEIGRAFGDFSGEFIWRFFER